MKNLLFVLPLIIIGCATDSQQSSGKKTMMAEETKPMTKKVEKKVVEDMAKKINKAVDDKKPTPAKMDMKANAVSGTMTTCSYGENKRVIENKSLTDGGCEVQYTKDGSMNVIANAKHQVEYCQEVYERVAKKLAAAGFDCK